MLITAIAIFSALAVVLVIGTVATILELRE